MAVGQTTDFLSEPDDGSMNETQSAPSTFARDEAGRGGGVAAKAGHSVCRKISGQVI
jgi:hypothetical protein